MTSLEKLLNEVQVILRDLTQNNNTEFHLEINPYIKRIVELARAEGRRPNAADLGDLIQYSEFLNILQNGVNHWAESIRKVTRMDRDPSSGTALQEATFWINIERALTRIQEIRESDEVVVTYEAIDSVVKKTEYYVNQWTRYQSLWDLQSEVFFEQLGSDLNSWMQAIMEIKKSRAMVDSPESQHQIFPFVVDYTRVQQKIALKYDYWQREVQQKFGIQLGTQMNTFYAEIRKARQDLETQSIDSANTSDTIALITHVQNLKKQLKTSQDEVNKYVAGQKLLNTNRYTFPPSWLYAEIVEGEWSALRDILNRKDVAIQSQVPSPQTKITEEDKLPENHTNDINKSKPIQGTQHPKATNSAEDKFKHLKEKRANIIKARNARKINDSSMTNVNLNDSSMINVSLQATNKLEIDELKKEMREMDKKFHQLLESIQQRHNALLQHKQRIEHLERMLNQQNGQSNGSPCSTNESIVVLDDDSPPAATTNSASDGPSKSMTTPSGTAVGKGEGN